MPNHEWRLLPLVRALPDDIGMILFVAMHVPIFAVLIALIASSNPRTRVLSRVILGAFLVIHALLHALFMRHPHYEISSLLSEILIFSGAMLGAVYLTLEWRERHARAFQSA